MRQRNLVSTAITCGGRPVVLVGNRTLVERLRGGSTRSGLQSVTIHETL